MMLLVNISSKIKLTQSPIRSRKVLFAALCLTATACGAGIDPVADATSVAHVAPSALIELEAKGSRFDQSIIVVANNAEITVVLDNHDRDTLNNFSLYTDKKTRERLHQGELFAGVETRETTITSPPPGIYFFRCDVHPTLVTK